MPKRKPTSSRMNGSKNNPSNPSSRPNFITPLNSAKPTNRDLISSSKFDNSNSTPLVTPRQPPHIYSYKTTNSKRKIKSNKHNSTIAIKNLLNWTIKSSNSRGNLIKNNLNCKICTTTSTPPNSASNNSNKPPPRPRPTPTPNKSPSPST